MARPRHIAVVPVVALDNGARRALEFAGTVAPLVVALHVREQPTRGNESLEHAWSAHAASVPLVVVDAAGRDWCAVFHAALDALRRAARPSLLTVVVPEGVGGPGLA